MKKINILIVSILLSIGSCVEVLNEEVVSGVTSEYLNTPEGFKAGINASYEKLREYYGTDISTNLTAFGVDEYTNGPHGADHHVNKYETALNADDRSVWALWQHFYIGINNCNAVINRGKDVDLPEAEKSRGIAEARFLRAHFYFTLVEQFGPVHLTLEETVGVEIEATRTSEDLVYEAIIEDLEFAIEHLPVKQEEFGRATEPAAKNMLALVLLTRGHKTFAHSEDFNRAAVLANEVINNYDHFLLNDIEESYSHDNEENAEIIWSVQYTTDKLLNGSGNILHRLFRPRYYFVPGLIRDHFGGTPAIRYKPTYWFLENFRPLDVDSRYRKSFYDVWYFNSAEGLAEGASVGDTAVWITDKYLSQEDYDAHIARLPPSAVVMSWNPGNSGDPWNMYTQGEDMVWPNPTKWDDHKRLNFLDNDGNRNVIIYKLSETYLIAAEAMLMRDGNGNAAVEYINAIRRRAAWPGKEAEMEISAADVDIDFILDERSRELFGEQKRWLDLKRTGKLLERVIKYNPDAAPNIKEYHLLRPIPTNQIVRTVGNYPQNPGY